MTTETAQPTDYTFLTRVEEAARLALADLEANPL
jgi:hypothetical protein